jgi:hypothetical protein
LMLYGRLTTELDTFLMMNNILIVERIINLVGQKTTSLRTYL